MDRVRVGVIGYGRMGEIYLHQMTESELWEVVYICDVSENAAKAAEKAFPKIKVIRDEDVIFNDPTIDAVGLFALADSRPEQIAKAVARGKHIICEKPVADTLEREWKAVEAVEKGGILSTVNLYLRNSWYHNTIRDFVASGEIGRLAILRICHLTPGLAPGEGHEYEGPTFHDCGMHYVDILRWYSGSEYKTWQAQALRMWDYKDPWWLTCHGTFENGVVFEVTQGFVYGQLSKDQTHRSYIDVIGTQGIARMTHDFKTAHVELRGVNTTEILDKPFGGKNVDVLCDRFARSVMAAQADPSLPALREAAIASQYAWKFLEDAEGRELPSIGTEEELVRIRQRRSQMTDGYGLLPRR